MAETAPDTTQQQTSENQAFVQWLALFSGGEVNISFEDWLPAGEPTSSETGLTSLAEAAGVMAIGDAGAATAIPQDEPSPGHRIPEWLASLPRNARHHALASALAGLVLSTGAVVATGGLGLFRPPDEDRCTDITHIETNGGNRTWSEVAAVVEGQRGYTVSAAVLAAANAGKSHDRDAHRDVQLAVRDVRGKIKDELAVPGTYCLLVPAPLESDQFAMDGNTSLAQLALAAGTTPQALHSLNPNRVPSSDTVPIPAGTVVWLAAKVGPNLVLRPLPVGGIHAVTHGDGKALAPILMANLSLLGGKAGNGGFDVGQDYYLPWTGTDVTAWMREKGLTPAAILQAYTAQGAYDLTKRNAQPVPTPKHETGLPDTVPSQYKALFERAAAKFGASPQFVTALFLSEHRDVWKPFDTDWSGDVSNPTLSADKRASGPFQFLPGTWAAHKQDGNGDGAVDVNNLYDAAFAAADMAARLGALPNTPLGDVNHPFRPGTLLYAAAAYNWGGGNIRDRTSHDTLRTDSSVPPDKQAYILNVYNLLVSGFTKGAGGHYYPDGVSGMPTNAVTTPKPAAPEGALVPGQIHLDPSKYSSRDGSIWTVRRENDPHGNYYMVIDGEKVPLWSISYPVKLRLIENALNGMQLSPQGYTDFVANLQDISTQVHANPFLVNFDGTKNDLGRADIPEEIKYFVFHYTATQTDANDMDGYTAALSMQRGGKGVGSYAYINNKGKAWVLTHDHVVDVQDHNLTTMGVETAAAGQETVTSAQYSADIYMGIDFLERYGFIKKGVPVTAVVNRMIKGHGEFYGEHTDYNKIVMDPLRVRMIDLLVRLGYTS